MTTKNYSMISSVGRRSFCDARSWLSAPPIRGRQIGTESDLRGPKGRCRATRFDRAGHRARREQKLAICQTAANRLAFWNCAGYLIEARIWKLSLQRPSRQLGRCRFWRSWSILARARRDRLILSVCWMHLLPQSHRPNLPAAMGIGGFTQNYLVNKRTLPPLQAA
jgi:hypothetical protein